jgi:hypothetical protein
MTLPDINHIQRDPVMVDFSITKGNGDALDEYILYEQKNSYSYPIGTFATTPNSAGATSLATPRFVPLNESIRFLPVFTYSTSTNEIIQYKWNFGDGRESLILSPPDPITYTLHKYTFGLDTTLSNGAYNSTSMVVSLTAIDKYYRHTRCSKVIYPHVSS